MPSTTIKYFSFDHLPTDLADIAYRIAGVAYEMEQILPDSAEKSAGMRKLLEAKDCFVRAKLDMRLVTNEENK